MSLEVDTTCLMDRQYRVEDPSQSVDDVLRLKLRLEGLIVLDWILNLILFGFEVSVGVGCVDGVGRNDLASVDLKWCLEKLD